MGSHSLATVRVVQGEETLVCVNISCVLQYMLK